MLITKIIKNVKRIKIEPILGKNSKKKRKARSWWMGEVKDESDDDLSTPRDFTHGPPRA